MLRQTREGWKHKWKRDRRADATREMLARQEEERRNIAVYRAETIDVESMNIVAPAFGFTLEQINAARKKIRSTKMIDGASDVELVALGMVRMSEAEKYGWVNPNKTTEGDKPKAVMMPFIGDPFLRPDRPIETAAATQSIVPLDEGGRVRYSSSRSVERCIRPCVATSAEDLVRMLLNNTHGSTTFVDKRWTDRQKL